MVYCLSHIIENYGIVHYRPTIWGSPIYGTPHMFLYKFRIKTWFLPRLAQQLLHRGDLMNIPQHPDIPGRYTWSAVGYLCV